jgi:hypothetical protein
MSLPVIAGDALSSGRPGNARPAGSATPGILPGEGFWIPPGRRGLTLPLIALHCHIDKFTGSSVKL